MGTKRSLIGPIALVTLGMVVGVAGVIAFNFITKNNPSQPAQEEQYNPFSPVADETTHYAIEQSLAEDTCINEELVYSKFGRSKYTFQIPKKVIDTYIHFELRNDFDKNGNYLAQLRWTGYDKEFQRSVSFECIVSSDVNKHTTIHYLQVEGNTIAGDKNYKRYREDGKETYMSKYVEKY